MKLLWSLVWFYHFAVSQVVQPNYVLAGYLDNVVLSASEGLGSHEVTEYDELFRSGFPSLAVQGYQSERIFSSSFREAKDRERRLAEERRAQAEAAQLARAKEAAAEERRARAAAEKSRKAAEAKAAKRREAVAAAEVEKQEK